MIFIALGANLPSRYGTPAQTIEAAKQALCTDLGLEILAASRTWLTAPVPASDQPWYSNAVISVECPAAMTGPLELLEAMQRIEQKFGRLRSVANAPRVIDLDLIAFDDRIFERPDIQIPHPRMAERGFVLYPLHEIAPRWRHPVTGKRVYEMIGELPSGQRLQILEDNAA